MSATTETKIDARLEAGARALAAASLAGQVLGVDRAMADEDMRATWLHTAAHVLIAADAVDELRAAPGGDTA